MADTERDASRLVVAKRFLAAACAAKEAAEALSRRSRALGGGIPGFGGSGSQRAGALARAASERAARAHLDADARIERWSGEVKSLERRIAEAGRVRYTAADLKGATHIRARGSWRRVVRVSEKSVTVATPYSWTDRVPIGQITEFKIIDKEGNAE